MIPYSTLLQNSISKLTFYFNNTHEASNAAQWLIEKVTGKSHAQLLSQSTISPAEEAQINHYISQIITDHKPVQYILGSVPFLNLDILVEPPLLIPRPETEEWTAKFIKDMSLESFTLMDLCSGTGCIGLAVAQARPHAQVTATDIHPQAVTLINKNKLHNNIENCTVILSDLFENVSGTFDFIVANPPYIAHEEWLTLEPHVKNWESPQALVAEGEGYALIEQIIKQARDYLNPPKTRVPQLWIEIGYAQAEQVIQLCYQHGYSNAQVLVDSYGNNRVITANL